MNALNRLANTQAEPLSPASKDVEDRLRALFRGWAYMETHFDILQPAGESTTERLGDVYSLTDRTGGALTLRSDFTALVAREAATLGRNIPRPLRRAYAGTAFRRPERTGDRRREIRQAGVELIGASGLAADAEIVKLASDGLSELRLKDARIHLGHVGFVRSLLRSSNLQEDAETLVCDLLAQHDRATLSAVLSENNVTRKIADALDHLLDLVGSDDVLDRARDLTDDPEAQKALDDLEELLRLLDGVRLPTPVILDLTEVRNRSYYTGIRFEAFAPSSGFPILRGGRYDHLLSRFGNDEPAVGCAFEIDRIAPLSSLQSDGSCDVSLIRFSRDTWADAVNQAEQLRRAGERVALDVSGLTTADLGPYTDAHRIGQVINMEPEGKGVSS